MDSGIGVLLISIPIIVTFILLVKFRWGAHSSGVVAWLLTTLIAIIFFSTDPRVAIIATVAGVVRSFPISLMVGTSIFMITYMHVTGALKRVIIFFKTLGGKHKSAQIMLINLGLGLFLVGLGATPVSMLPPVMLALGYSPLVAVALPSVGYDPLTTYALLGIPVVVFTDIFKAVTPWWSWPANIDPLFICGSTFAMFMPVVSTGIALAMLWIAGGKKMLFDKESLFLALLSGFTAGGVAIITNNPLIGQTTLTNVYAGLAVIGVIALYLKIKKLPIIDRSILTDEDLESEKSMKLWAASSPWIILVIFALATNMFPPIRDYLFHTLAFPVTIGHATIATRPFWNAYTLVLIATFLGMIFLPHDKKTLKETLSLTKKRAPKPVLASAIFFAMAEILNESGSIISPTGEWLTAAQRGLPEMNMIFLLASVTAATFGVLYPLTSAYLGLMAGFISGSETSAIAMFTRYHSETAQLIGANAMVVGAANGIGGGLASVLSPAKLQNAAAVIDKIGIEGQVIKYALIVALLMTTATAIMTFLLAFI